MAGARILVVTGFFPPYSPLGAVRVPALIEYWRARGHEVRVIAMENPSVTGMLDLPLPREQVVYAPFTLPGLPLENVVRPLLGLGYADTAEASGGSGQGARPGRPPRLQGLRKFYQQAVQFPDRYRNWTPGAIASGLALAQAWRPDLIYSSGPPHSGHVVASRLTRRLGTPWITELRDTWANNPYSDAPWPIESLQTLYANAVLGRAAAAVTLTQTARAEVETALGVPTIVSYNGFNAEDFDGLEDVAPLDAERLTILHAGVIYAGRRDPVALFQALAILGKLRHAVRVKFYHDQMEAVERRALRLGVRDCIEICAPVPRREILRIERQADVLLLCRWADPRDDGVIPGKLFEYIGARRPILAVGSTTGEATDIVREGGFGLVSNTPMEIAEALRAWIVAKREAGGRLPDLPKPPTLRFLRDTQFRQIDPLLERLAPRVGARHLAEAA
jgi:glycosyltransferase involved in cell wall biosynthesis